MPPSADTSGARLQRRAGAPRVTRMLPAGSPSTTWCWRPIRRATACSSWCESSQATAEMKEVGAEGGHGRGGDAPGGGLLPGHLVVPPGWTNWCGHGQAPPHRAVTLKWRLAGDPSEYAHPSPWRRKAAGASVPTDASSNRYSARFQPAGLSLPSRTPRLAAQCRPGRRAVVIGDRRRPRRRPPSGLGALARPRRLTVGYHTRNLVGATDASPAASPSRVPADIRACSNSAMATRIWRTSESMP